jgi:hypothetical protein
VRPISNRELCRHLTHQFKPRRRHLVLLAKTLSGFVGTGTQLYGEATYQLTVSQPKEREDAKSFLPSSIIKEQFNRLASIERQKNGDAQARDTNGSRKTRHCEGRARTFLLANSHGFSRGVVRLCPNACRLSVWRQLGNRLGLGGFHTRHIRSGSDDPKARGTTGNGTAARFSGLVTCQLLCNHRPGFQLGLRISVVLSTIRFFLRSSHRCDGFDYGVLRRHRIPCSSVDSGELADSSASLRICVSLPCGHCLEVGSSSISATCQLLIDALTRQVLA